MIYFLFVSVLYYLGKDLLVIIATHHDVEQYQVSDNEQECEWKMEEDHSDVLNRRDVESEQHDSAES